MALLALTAATLLVIAGRLEPSLEDIAIAFALVVYFASMGAFLLALIAWRSFLAAGKHGPRLAFGASTSIVLGYLCVTSWTILAILNSTDL